MKGEGACSFEEALQKGLAYARPIKTSEFISVSQALGRVLAQDVYAKKNLPSFDNSAMDGFAFSHTDAGKRLKIKQTIYAGDVVGASLSGSECYKVMTGAQLPSDVDTVAPIERCETVDDTSVRVPKDIAKGANFRKKGEEIQCGEVLLKAGKIIQAADIALLSAQGITAVLVVSRVRIAIVASGNEIKEPWEAANDDEIYNANAFGIVALLQTYGFDAEYVGAVPDELSKTVRFIENLRRYDVLITTGGISRGEKDFLYEAFLQNGLQTLFQGVRLKPGHPVTMGVTDTTFVMGLPGNPLATMLTLFGLGIVILYKIAGAEHVFHTTYRARISQALSLRAGRVDTVIGVLEEDKFIPTNDNKIGSGMLTPLAKSDAVVFFDEPLTHIEKGAWVNVVRIGDTTRSQSMKLTRPE